MPAQNFQSGAICFIALFAILRVHATLPPLNSMVSIINVADTRIQFRHCSYQGSMVVRDDGELQDDFNFHLVAALNGAPLPAASLQSVNFPAMYIALTGIDGQPQRVGIAANPNHNDATFLFAPSAHDPTNFSLISQTRNAKFYSSHPANPNTHANPNLPSSQVLWLCTDGVDYLDRVL